MFLKFLQIIGILFFLVMIVACILVGLGQLGLGIIG